MQPAQAIDRTRQRGPGVLVERTAWAFGLACLVTWGALYIDGATGARHELERFALAPGGRRPAARQHRT